LEIKSRRWSFLGPKIDIKVYGALKKAHQCGTI
jgi:threonyl-tRNA synthetase